MLQNKGAFAHASAEMKQQPWIATLAAVQKNGLALKAASEVMKNDATIVRAAVQQNGRALEHAGEGMKNDATIVGAAVQQDEDGGEYRAASKVEVWSPPRTSTAGRFQKKTTCRPPLETLGCKNTEAPVDNAE